MDTFLTLVIALGGIATGIGAIWAALLARRQARVTERSLAEQNEIARSQARLTERSLAQTESSLAEQVRSLREQNERARHALQFDLLNRLADRIESPIFLDRRREAARYLLDNAFVGEELVGTRSLPHAAFRICDLYEDIGELVRIGVLSAEPVWSRFSAGAQVLWTLCKPAIENRRQEWEDPALYEEFERLYCVIEEIERERGIPTPTPARLRQILESDATLGEDHPQSYGEGG